MAFKFLLERRREVWKGSPNRLNQVGEKPGRVVIVAIDCQPCGLHPLCGQYVGPLRSQGALSVAGGRVDENQLRPWPRAHAVEDSAPRHCAPSEVLRSKPGERGRRIVGTR